MAGTSLHETSPAPEIWTCKCVETIKTTGKFRNENEHILRYEMATSLWEPRAIICEQYVKVSGGQGRGSLMITVNLMEFRITTETLT